MLALAPSTRITATLILVWVFVCIASFYATSEAAFLFAYFALPATALVIPLLTGWLGADVFQPSVTNVNDTSKLTSIAAWFIATISYLLATLVLSRMLEIPWRQMKFGSPVLDLGKSAALFFGVVAVVTAIAAKSLLKRVPHGSLKARLTVASLSMLGFSSILYFLLGLSPLVAWRP